MPKYDTPEFKKHRVEAWRTSGLTRRQYCESQVSTRGPLSTGRPR